MKEVRRKQNSAVISRRASPASLLDIYAGNCQRALVDESVLTRIQTVTHNRSVMVAMQGTTCMVPLTNSNSETSCRVSRAMYFTSE
jgi:hypothetical protein